MSLWNRSSSSDFNLLRLVSLIFFFGLSLARDNSHEFINKSVHRGLPPFLPGSPLVNGFPWGSRTAENSNPLTDVPNTGVIRRYEFTVARGKISPDGVEKDVILVNGQFPGPTIEANWGDTIEVKVNNNIVGPEEGTAVHWHGIRQNKTPWFDGVPSIGQCPIAPGRSFTYRFQADSYGTSWWHAHYTAQYAAGCYGPMVIYGPKHAQYDIDLGPVMLGDYHHASYESIVQAVTSVTNSSSKYVPKSDNTLIQGRNPYNCSLAMNGTKCNAHAPYAKFHFHSGKTYRLRLINAGAAAVIRFSIDGHTLQVIANDFTPIVPYETNVVTLGVGQRSDVIVKAIGNCSQSFWMRGTQALNCTSTTSPYGKAVVLYERANSSSLPTTAPYFLPELNCANDALSTTTPLFAMTPDPNPPTIEVINITLGRNSTGNNVFYLNNVTFYADYNSPSLLLAQEQNFTFPEAWNVHNYKSSSSIRIVLNNNNPAQHPMHLHGHNMYVLAEGEGPWDGKTITNPQNPQRRDTQQLRRYGHIVIQIDADNPGIWPLHCHIAWHQSMGLAMNVLERPELITEREIPMIMQQTCVDWDAYSSSHVVDQIDSGI